MTYWTSTKNTCTSCTWFVNSNMPSWGRQLLSRPQYEGMQNDFTLEMDAEADNLKTMVQGNVIRNCRDNNGPFIYSF